MRHPVGPLRIFSTNQIIEKNFWEIGEVRRAAIFCLRRREEVEVSPDPNEARYVTHRIPSYDFDIPSDA